MNDEEDSEKLAIDIYMKKSSKLWKNMFTKYANVGFKVIPLHERGSFEGLKQS